MGISVSFLRNYYRDPVTAIMYCLVPRDQWALSMATGCRPVSPMVISVSGIASRPIFHLATRQISRNNTYAPKVMRDMWKPNHIEWRKLTPHLFISPGWYDMVHWLYPEVSHMYDVAGPANMHQIVSTYFHTDDPRADEGAKNLYMSLYYEDAEHSETLHISSHLTLRYSEEFYQRALELFVATPHHTRMYSLTWINQRHVNNDLSAGRPVASHIVNGILIRHRLIVRCDCAPQPNHRAISYIARDLLRPLLVSRDTYTIAARIAHSGNLGACAGNLRVDIL